MSADRVKTAAIPHDEVFLIRLFKWLRRNGASIVQAQRVALGATDLIWPTSAPPSPKTPPPFRRGDP